MTKKTTRKRPAKPAEAPQKPRKAPQDAQRAASGKSGPGTKQAGNAPRTGTKPSTRKPRTDTKQAKLVAMLKRAEGATVDDIAKAFGWQPHTVRGALYGTLKKKLDLDITSEKVEGRGRVYRIAG